MVLLGALLIILIYTLFYSGQSKAAFSPIRSSEETGSFPTVIFHAHIAKTAGSTISRFLARRYHGICSNKGVSFMQTYEDFNATSTSIFGERGLDTFVKKELLQSWGLHNCALISLEVSSQQWLQIASSEPFRNQTTAVMIPCRDPVDHILSQCNFRDRNFTEMITSSGGQKACAEALPECQVQWKRYDHSLLEYFDKVVLFKYDSFDDVTRYLDKTLPKRAIELKHETQYGMYTTNKDRSAENERFSPKCPEEMLRKNLLREWSYYRLCETFLGSSTWQEFDSHTLRSMIKEQDL